jgi:hypothetical protein
MSSSSALQRAVTLVFLGSQVTACTSWTTQSVSPEEFFRGRTADEVRITRADSTKVVLVRPRLVGDSVLGDSVDAILSQKNAVPLADIQSVAVRRKDPTKTTLRLGSDGGHTGGGARRSGGHMLRCRLGPIPLEWPPGKRLSPPPGRLRMRRG